MCLLLRLLLRLLLLLGLCKLRCLQGERREGDGAVMEASAVAAVTACRGLLLLVVVGVISVVGRIAEKAVGGEVHALVAAVVVAGASESGDFETTRCSSGGAGSGRGDFVRGSVEGLLG